MLQVLACYRNAAAHNIRLTGYRFVKHDELNFWPGYFKTGKCSILASVHSRATMRRQGISQAVKKINSPAMRYRQARIQSASAVWIHR